ncbi:hypothetical protein TUBRATIS_11530 [Tubulinosema ratisbonensis]|uniref:Uncharacterized protein n=1 Tax=Tubulinosema ratisbonensis TaxID=291195 RepID=A0A437AMN4_9MICR|nr:hypothetical protein TUBRATIS_11530 [Tubulinosema ratisbonensis]
MIVICIVLLVILCPTIYCLYLYLTKELTKKEVKNFLKLSLGSFDNELIKYLVNKEENLFNQLVINYLSNKSDELLEKLAEYLRNKHYMSRSSSFTRPALVIRALIIEIVFEQIKVNYDHGFVFDNQVFQNLEKNAPFVKRYCVIAKTNDNNYFTNVCAGSFDININQMILSGFNQFVEKVTKNGISNFDNIFFPDIAIVVFKRSNLKYNVDLKYCNYVRFMTLYNGEVYSLNNLLVKIPKFIAFDYELRSGEKVAIEGNFSKYFVKYSNSYLAFITLKSIKSL